MTKILNKKIFLILLFIFSIVKLSLPLIEKKYLFTDKFDPKKYEKKYNSSQYIIPQSKNPISDEDLLAYAGYKYINGLNPILINSDHPPLGKYLIGLFILLTKNHHASSFFFGFLSLIFFIMLIYKKTRSIEKITLGFFFIALDSMFLDQIIHSPILDIIQLSFFLLYLYFLNLWFKKRKLFYLITSAIILGLFSSIKIYFPSIIIIITGSIFLLLKKYPLKNIFIFILINISLSFFAYSLTYLKYFLEGNNLRSFLGVQKWIFLFWKNNSVRNDLFLGNAITLILFNKWKIWWGKKNFINYENWTIFWPIFFIIGLVISIQVVKKMIVELTNKNRQGNSLEIAHFLSLWIIFYTIYLNFIPISPRYLFLLFFPIYLLILIKI